MIDESPSSEPQQPADPAEPNLYGRTPEQRPRRNDRISPLAVVLLIGFWVIQSSFLPSLIKLAGKRTSLTRAAASEASDGLPSEVEQGILTIDLTAKGSYTVSSLISAAGGSSAPSIGSQLTASSRKSRKDALDETVRLFQQYPDQPALARRLILLRAESGQPAPLAALPGRTKTASPIEPLAAFDPSSAASMPRSVRADLSREHGLWQQLFTGPTVDPSQKAALAAQISKLDNLRWWGKIALHQLYLRSGDSAAAGRVLDQASQEAMVSVVATGALGLAQFAVVLLGVVLVVVLIVRVVSAIQSKQTANQYAAVVPAGYVAPRTDRGDSIFDPVAPLVADEDRRLGAGDLANMFVLYLALMSSAPYWLTACIRWALGGRSLQDLPYATILNVTIVAEAIGTAACGFATLGAMAWLARRRGANLAQEIGLGLGRDKVGRLLLFGLLGWAVSLPLALGFGALARLVFHNAPEPANPAIPLLMSSPGIAMSIVLYVVVAIIAPFFEETFFRGLFYNAARLRVGTVPAIALTGLAFGLSHQVGIAEQLTLAVLGATFAWMAQTRKSLLPGMFAHCLQNSFAYGFFLFSLMTVSPR